MPHPAPAAANSRLRSTLSSTEVAKSARRPSPRLSLPSPHLPVRNRRLPRPTQLLRRRSLLWGRIAASSPPREQHAPALALLAFPLILFFRSMQVFSRILFLLALALSFTGILSPPRSLLAGILFGLAFTHAYTVASRN